MAEVKYNELKPNSQKYKDESQNAEERPKIDKVITSPVTKPKHHGLGKVLGFFLVESPSVAAKQVLKEEIVPGIGRLIFNALSSSLEHMFGFESGSYEIDKSSYHDYSKHSRKSDPNRKSVSFNNLEEFREWTFSEDDAEAILEALNDSLDVYGDAPIALIYEACQIPPDESHYNYGWTDLKNADVIHTRKGWRLQLPKVVHIK